MLKLKIGPQNSTHTPSCLCLNHKQNVDFFQNLSTQNLKAFSISSVINFIAIQSVRFYQATFSYFFGGNCRYYPSCSHYAVESFERHRFDRALVLTLKRLLSCHPFSRRPIYDPVPIPVNITQKDECYE